MKKRFVAKHRKKKSKLKYLALLVGIYITIEFVLGYVLSLRLVDTNEAFIKALLHDANHHLLYEQNEHTLFTKVTKFFSRFDTKEPLSILKAGLSYQAKVEKKEKPVEGSTDDDKVKQTKTKYVNDPNPTVMTSTPRVYIYNTHQLENYSMENLEVYNITPNVMMTSYLLREKLNQNQIPTLVEEQNFKEFMNQNPWVGKNQYKVSRHFLEATLKQYPKLDLIIDLHRDAILKEASTKQIGEKTYAKVLFVVGTAHPKYEKNLELAEKFHQMIDRKYPGLSRGVLKKEGATVNGIYNQDVSEKMLLIECGGYENTIDEVANTTDVLTEIITEYIGVSNEIRR